MRYLRCIGGPRHGSVIPLAGSFDDVKLIDPRAPQSRTSYTERAVETAGGKVNFLAPVGMADIEALRIALGPVSQHDRDLHAEIDRLCRVIANEEQPA